MIDYRLFTGCSHALHETCAKCRCPCCGTRAVQMVTGWIPASAFTQEQVDQLTKAMAQRAANPTAPVVHVLRYGSPLCRFSPMVPADWPEGHRWVGLDEWIHATCNECKALAEQLTTPDATR